MNASKQKSLPGLDVMSLIIVVWLCTLPFIALLVAPLFGIQTAAIVAGLLLITMLVYCRGACIPLLVQFYKEKLPERRKRPL